MCAQETGKGKKENKGNWMQEKKVCRYDREQMSEIKGKSTHEVKLHRICKESRHMRER